MEVSEEILKVVLGLLIMISTGLSAWALKEIIALRSRVDKNETSDELKSKEYERRFQEIKDENRDHMLRVYQQLEKIDSKITSVHKRIDDFRKPEGFV